MKFVQTLKNNPDLLKVIEIFKNPYITPEAVVDAENRFLVALYGYSISVSKMASLPPTEAAAHQHSLRVYHQIQHWLGNRKRSEDWDWETTIGAPTCQNSEAPCP
ncbi:hypothetical protein AVEN_60463-1 [Araneus ventricosus]|uniref:Uncharacterized protein n=1 Tax=Araneus ventricosus TaxID=182803 RepID=A0A4Y2K9Y9_ARAVE|nr:hypothetical protein AVEN_60463-1 [Araneus ventricosus]